MSISDSIVVMKEGVVQQIGKPQQVYDDPVNLFVAKFLGTPPINVLDGRVKDGKVCIGEDAVLDAPGVADQEVYVGIRPEGFELEENGTFRCALSNVEVMGRDLSIVCTNPASHSPIIRAIVDADNVASIGTRTLRFRLKAHKVFLFHKETEERLRCELK